MDRKASHAPNERVQTGGPDNVGAENEAPAGAIQDLVDRLSPRRLHENMCAAEQKLARLPLKIDKIETRPGNRITVWEALAQWILQADEDTIRTQTEGG